MFYPFEYVGPVSLRIDIDDYWEQATVDSADTYHEDRGNSTWTGTDDAKSQALQRAWDYLKTLPWIGEAFSLSVEQPEDITKAHILLSLEELKVPGVLTPALTNDDYISSKEIGGAIKKVYRSNAPAWKRFRGVDMLLAPYITSSVNVRLERG